MDGNDLWEMLFGIMEGNVPDELTVEVLDQLASAIAQGTSGSAQDAQRLDPKGAGPTPTGDAP